MSENLPVYANDCERHLAVLDENTRPGVVNAIRRSFRILCTEDQARTAVKVMNRLAGMVVSGTAVRGGEEKVVPLRTMIRAAEAYAEIYARYMELSVKLDPPDQNVNVTRINMNVDADPAVLAERARLGSG